MSLPRCPLRAPLSFALLLLAAACGSTSTPGVSPDASTDSSADAPNSDAGHDDCTARGPLYACQAQASCAAEYMPVPAYSCGSTSLHCCLKGAIPPDAGGDAGPDASADACTPHGAGYACQNQPACPGCRPV